MGDSGFSNFKKPDPSPFRLFCEDTFLNVFGNSNASPPRRDGAQAQSATEPSESSLVAISDASEWPPLDEHMAQIDHVSAQLEAAQPTCQHQWLRPDNGCIECAVCGATRNHYGD
jgi:hypothetical protein